MESQKYVVLACDNFQLMQREMAEGYGGRFEILPVLWRKDESKDTSIVIKGLETLRGKHVIFLASFENNTELLSQFQVLVTLLEAFISSLTIFLPFFPTGTMERVTKPGQVATASTLARLFSNLPRCGPPSRVMIYDIHALQSRYYLYGNAIASLHTAIPILLRRLSKGIDGMPVEVIAFPDEGAYKRFNFLVKGTISKIAVCSKVRDGDRRFVTIHDGKEHIRDRHVVIIDDLVRSGNTLVECALEIQKAGAKGVSAFCTHGAFKKESSDRFLRPSGDRCSVFSKFFITDSVPATAAQLLGKEPFEVLPLIEQFVGDL